MSTYHYYYNDPRAGVVFERRLSRLGGFFSVSDRMVTSPNLITPSVSVGSLDSPRGHSTTVDIDALIGQLEDAATFPRLAAAGLDLSRVRRAELAGPGSSFGQASANMVSNLLSDQGPSISRPRVKDNHR